MDETINEASGERKLDKKSKTEKRKARARVESPQP